MKIHKTILDGEKLRIHAVIHSVEIIVSRQSLEKLHYWLSPLFSS